jgi:hypothetical protein
MKKIIIIIITLFSIGLLLYFTLFKNKEENILEKFTDSCGVISLTGLMSNPLVDRNGTNVIINPSTEVKSNVVISSPGRGCWNDTMDLSNMFLVINLNKLTKINYIITQGIKYFKVFYSSTDNDLSSYDEILYQDKDLLKEESSSIYFIASGYENVTKFGNLSNIDGQPIFAKYIKIVPVSALAASAEFGSSAVVSITPAGTTPTGAAPTVTTPDCIGPNGVKIEIMGIPNDAKPNNEGDSLIGVSKFYDIDDDLISNNWTDEKVYKDSRLKIIFEEDGIVVPKTIYSIIFGANDNSADTKQWVKEFSITYTHKQSKLSDTIYYIKGNTNCGENIFQYYLDKPIVATELVIKPTKLNDSTKPASMKIIDIMGSQINTVQEKVLLEKNKQQYCKSDTEDSTGSVSDLLGKQAEIQQLCDAIDLQDQIKENNIKIQKNRQYIMQLEDHDKKIADLESIVQKMKHLKTLRQKATDTGMTEQKDKQSEMDIKLQQLLEDRKKSQSRFNIKLNIQPSTLTGLEKITDKVAGSDTARTPVEGFVNYSNYDNQGYNYVRYVDKTNQMQKNHGFYEDVALNSANCDMNVKFIKKMK